MAEMSWRQPIYLLLDCSASMAGEPLEAMKQGVKVFLSELRHDVQLAEESEVSILAFDTFARQMLPLTSVAHVVEPALWVGGVSSLSAALTLLRRCLQQDKVADKKDWKPIVFLFSDGNWTGAYDRANYEDLFTKVCFVVCAAGSQVNLAGLQRVSEEIITLNTLSFGAFIRHCTCTEQ